MPAFLDGVDAIGNPSSANGYDGYGKSFKDTEFGIVVQLSGGFVRNEFGRSHAFSNRGVPVVDPETNETQTATADLELVSRPFYRQGSVAGQVGIYDPAPVEEPTEN